MLDDTKKTTIIIISSGQVANSSLYQSFSQFSIEFAKQSHPWLAPLAPLRVGMAYLLDMAYYGTIDRYKKGALDSATFRRQINKQLGKELAEEPFFTAWNAMSGVSERSALELKAVLELPHIVCIISSTNEAQHQHFLEQLKMHGVILEGNEQVKIVNSFEQGTLDNKILGRTAIAAYDRPGNHIISLNHHFTEKTLGLSHAVCRCYPFDSRKPEASLAHAVKAGIAFIPATTPEREKEHDKESECETAPLLTPPSFNFREKEKERQRTVAANKGDILH